MKKRKVTMKDIAKEANVSIATVSNVLNGIKPSSYSYEKKQEILGLVETMNYTFNHAARSLAKNESDLIAVMLPPYMKRGLTESPFYYYLITGVENKAYNHNLDVIVKISKEDQKVDDLISWVRGRNLKGMIYVGVTSETELIALNKLNIPIVLVDSYSKLQLENIFYINTLDERGGILAARHFIEQGYKKICMLTTSLDERYVDYYRHKGFIGELKQHGMTETLMFVNNSTYPEGFDMSEEVVNAGCDAVFCTSDDLAFGVLDGLIHKGIKVPEEVGIIGFDNFERSRNNWLPLTTIGQDVIKKGEIAVDTLLQNESISSQIKVNVQLIKRKTT